MDLTVISTYRCNSKCQMCHVWQHPTHHSEEVSLATLAKLPHGFDNVNISGGEPTLRKDLEPMVDLLYSRARVMEISSNGLYVDRLIPIVRKYPHIKIRLSLEGNPQTNNQIRGEVNGYEKKIEGILDLKEAGGKDLGFATVVQDENADELIALYHLAQSMGVELSTSVLHNAWQFYKNDNYFYDQKCVAQQIEKLIIAMLKTNNVKNWFRAYLNLGLIKKILGQERLIRCTAGRDFIFIDPWSDVWACNVRSDLRMGNLIKDDWETIVQSEQARKTFQAVGRCKQNCWMVTTARTAMRSELLPFLPKVEPLLWVVSNKIKTALGIDIAFDRYIDYTRIRKNPFVQRSSYLNQSVEKKVQRAEDPHYRLKEFFN